MKTLNRTLLTLVLAVGVALSWSSVARTDWASSVSLLGVGEDYESALDPMIKVAAAMTVMVAGTRLMQAAWSGINKLRSRAAQPSR